MELDKLIVIFIKINGKIILKKHNVGELPLPAFETIDRPLVIKMERMVQRVSAEGPGRDPYTRPWGLYIYESRALQISGRHWFIIYMELCQLVIPLDN